MDALKIAGATLNQTPLDWKGNFDRIVFAIQQARIQQVELLCFPELTLTGYGAEVCRKSQATTRTAPTLLS